MKNLNPSCALLLILAARFQPTRAEMLEIFYTANFFYILQLTHFKSLILKRLCKMHKKLFEFCATFCLTFFLSYGTM